MDLSDYRKEINKVDDALIELFKKRMEISAGIAAYKASHGLPILDSSREKEKIAMVRENLPEELKDYGEELFQLLMDLGKDYQRKITE